MPVAYHFMLNFIISSGWNEAPKCPGILTGQTLNLQATAAGLLLKVRSGFLFPMRTRRSFFLARGRQLLTLEYGCFSSSSS